MPKMNILPTLLC